jgi:D-proline reductase (dithiol) PrdB
MQEKLMARLEDLPEATRIAATELPCPSFDTTPFVLGPPLSARRVAIVSSAGLIHRGAKPFARPLHDGAGEFRAVPATWHTRDILVSHASVNFDRTGYQRDLNVVFPIDRLHDLAADGTIGSVAETHYTFLPVADPTPADVADGIADGLRADNVDAVVLVPI